MTDKELIQLLIAGIRKLDAQTAKAYNPFTDECVYYDANTDTSCLIGCCTPHPDLLDNGPASNPDVLVALGLDPKPDQYVIDSLNQLQTIHDSYWQPHLTFRECMDQIVLTPFNELLKEALDEQSNL